LVLVGLCPVRAAGPTLAEARQRWLRGNYEEARAKYETLLKGPKSRAAAAVGLSRCWQAEGEYDKAQAAVEAALNDLPKSADLLARQAELFYLRGRWDEAEKAADRALGIDKDHFLARWARAQVYRDRGDLRKADAEFRWFVLTYNRRSEQDGDIKDPDELVLVGLADTEYARLHGKKLSGQIEFVLKEVYGDALKADKDYWWAEYYAGMLLLEKFNEAEALEAFGKAEEINASAAEVLTARGLHALQKLDMKAAEDFAKRALRINPRLTEALRLRADIYLAAGEALPAVRELEKARRVNPREEATLGRLAACYYLEGKKALLSTLAREVEKHDSRPGGFYATLGERLDERRRYDDAEKFYQKAIQLRPMLAAPQASLGLLYMRMGREEEARRVLVKAFEADDFNLRVSNTLQVLKHLDGYDKLRTEHFLLRFDAKNDDVLAHYLADYLEEIYARLAKQFRYRPKGPILIELFNNHHMFSGRVIALPDLHTIGACTGRMFAMVSPRDRAKVVAKPFNWARVLRHELVHIFNLEQTNFLVPHWFTEGLAVQNEGFPPPPSWNRLLKRRYPDHLLTLDTINLAFIRPRSQEEWNLAYLQGSLYVEYLKTFGEGAVGSLLQAYREGLDTPQAIKKVCKVDKAAFERGYRRHVEKVVRKLSGGETKRPLSFEELQKAHRQKPNDPDLAAELADRLLDMGEAPEALKLAKKVLADKPAHPLASYVRARLLLKGGEEDEAMRLLENAVDRQHPELKVLGLLGQRYFDAKKYMKAAAIFEMAHKADAHETRWLVQLARAYVQSNNNTKLIEVLKELAPTDADDLATRKKLATLLLEAGKSAEAERYAREALEIDVLDGTALHVLKEALRTQKKDEALRKFEKVFGK
jgi:tetratricopeptide (TPR) repeat protein